MAHDQDLADRIRRLVAWEDDIVEQQMRGGLAFLVNGNKDAKKTAKPGEAERAAVRELVRPPAPAGRS